jgi:predicted outer membrane repeat protein
MRRSPIILLIAGLMLSACSALAADWHVATTGDDNTGDGSIGAPYKTIGRALDQAAFSGDRILVADGTYADTGLPPGNNNVGLSLLGKAVTIKSLNGNPATCILDGAGLIVPIFQALSFEDPANTILDGFTLKNGCGYDGFFGERVGGAIVAAGPFGTTGMTIQNCIFESNNLNGSVTQPLTRGGALFAGPNSQVFVIDCVFLNNSATAAAGGFAKGGAIATEMGSVFLTDCVFSGNSVVAAAGSFGGAASANNGGIIATRCYFTSNSADAGGAIYAEGFAGAILTNTVLVRNTATTGFGGGLSAVSAFPSLMNCTVAGNTAQLGGGGAYFDSGTSGAIDNSIVWGNSSINGRPGVHSDTGGCIVSYSDIQSSGGSSAWSLLNASDGGGNIDADPLFVAAPTGSSDGNLRLSFGSPCIDVGNDILVQEPTDIEEQARIVETVDMGAYESVDALTLINNLKADIDLMIANGVNLPGNGNILKAHLTLAARQYSKGEIVKALEAILTFKAHVDLMVQNQRLTLAQGADLKASADVIMAAMQP